MFHIGTVIYVIILVVKSEDLLVCNDDDKWCNIVTFQHPEYLANQYAFYGSCAACIIICLFYLLLSSVLLQTHCQNYMANRTTNERFARRKPARGPDETGSSMNSSMASMGDIESDEILDTEKTNRKKKKARGCCGNCWKMTTSTKVTSQTKLYDYLAEKSTVINDS